MKMILRGSTRVFKNHLEADQEEITSPEILRMLASKNSELAALYDEESAFSQYCHDGSAFAAALLNRITPGGWVSLIYDEAAAQLLVETEYESSDDLSEEEITFLVRETLGQWSDGAGCNAMDRFSDSIHPYYVELNASDPEQVVISTRV